MHHCALPANARVLSHPSEHTKRCSTRSATRGLLLVRAALTQHMRPSRGSPHSRKIAMEAAAAAAAQEEALGPAKQLANGNLVANDGLVPLSKQFDLNTRHASISRHFPTALGIDDFMARLEVALSGFGFTGDNTIATTNLCRDEVTVALKDKIESVFGGSFNTNGLGAVLTCGVTGISAALSHSPVCVSDDSMYMPAVGTHDKDVLWPPCMHNQSCKLWTDCQDGKEHYAFFAFPHIAINAAGEIGAIARPGRPNKSCACGALQKALVEFKAEGYEHHCKVPGVHDPLDPEYSILKQRLARRARYESVDTTKMDLVTITKLAERTISNDLEFLAEQVVDARRANYAVVTGVQVHNWAPELTPEAGIPSFEFVAVARCYVVVNGVKTHLDLTKVPALSPRQLQLMARASITPQKEEEDVLISKTSAGTLKELPLKYLTQRLGVTKDPQDVAPPSALHSWTKHIITEGTGRDLLAPNMDDGEGHFTSFTQHMNGQAGTKQQESKGKQPEATFT